jgi:hypothetical protein
LEEDISEQEDDYEDEEKDNITSRAKMMLQQKK